MAVQSASELVRVGSNSRYGSVLYFYIVLADWHIFGQFILDTVDNFFNIVKGSYIGIGVLYNRPHPNYMFL